MCGIVYRKSLINSNIARDVLNMYKNQRSRGTEGFGFYIPDRKRIVYNTQEQGIVKTLKRTTATEMLFHHRMPTSTDNVLNACHPFRIELNKNIYVIVHNGYLSNENELKKEHDSKGYKYRSIQPDGRFNDSESLAYDIALFLEGEQTELKSKGAIAFIAIRNGQTIYFGRNAQSPLVYNLNDRHLTIRSEGKGIDCETNQLYIYENNQITKEPLEIPEYSYTSGYGWTSPGYNYNAYGWYDYEPEENEQPELLDEPYLSDQADELLITFGLTKAIDVMRKLVDDTHEEINNAWEQGDEEQALLSEYVANSHAKVLTELLNYKEVMK